MEVQISIIRKKVLHVVEGLTATMSQHNGGAPTFEELWASVSESKKLDIWWRDGILDLEENLMKWASATSQQYDLVADGTDYTLNLVVSDRWSDKLTGLLGNKIQYYLAHVVVAGWLGDFREIQAPNYTELAANDMKSILNILLYRELDFSEDEHRTDSEQGDGSGVEASAHRTDSSQSDSGVEASAHRTDTDQGDGSGLGDVVSRDKDDSYAGCCRKSADGTSRDKDDVYIRHDGNKKDCVDYNGAGVMIGNNAMDSPQDVLRELRSRRHFGF